MAKASRCTVCAHPKREPAEAAVAAGMSIRAAAKQYGVPYQSFDRHVRNCVSQAVALAKANREVREIVHGGKVLDRVEELQAVTTEILQAARDGVEVLTKQGKIVKIRDSELALKAVGQARKNLELIAKLTGELKPAEDTGPRLIQWTEIEALYVRASKQERIG